MESADCIGTRLGSWIVLEDLAVRIFTGKGEQDSSGFAFDLAQWRSRFGL